MISIKRYLDGNSEPEPTSEVPSKPLIRPKEVRPAAPRPVSLVEAWVQAYRATLETLGQTGTDACPTLGPKLAETLANIRESLTTKTRIEKVVASAEQVGSELQNWGRKTAQHYQQKAEEVKEVLLTVARTAESVSERDQRCAQQMQSVRTQLERIANLEDITQMRRSIEASATELKRSIDQMTSEGKSMMDGLQARVNTFQAKLEEAEKAASLDSLTRVRSRMWIEAQLQQRINAGEPFCVALLDIDGFKGVNDVHGHVVGDDLLRQFAGELKSACRSTDPVGRWGGDEFLILLDGTLDKAESQMMRVREWVCGSYSVAGKDGALKLQVGASIGIAQYKAPETMMEVVARADAAMYSQKAASRGPRRMQVRAS